MDEGKENLEKKAFYNENFEELGLFLESSKQWGNCSGMFVWEFWDEKETSFWLEKEMNGTIM